MSCGEVVSYLRRTGFVLVRESQEHWIGNCPPYITEILLKNGVKPNKNMFRPKWNYILARPIVDWPKLVRPNRNHGLVQSGIGLAKMEFHFELSIFRSIWNWPSPKKHSILAWPISDWPGFHFALSILKTNLQASPKSQNFILFLIYTTQNFIKAFLDCLANNMCMDVN